MGQNIFSLTVTIINPVNQNSKYLVEHFIFSFKTDPLDSGLLYNNDLIVFFKNCK